MMTFLREVLPLSFLGLNSRPNCKPATKLRRHGVFIYFLEVMEAKLADECNKSDEIEPSVK